MNKDLGLDAATFGFAAGVFFWGYFLFEVPSNIILEKLGARIWIARIMVTWGLLSGATAFCTGPYSFMTVRFLLGLAEAGFYPGLVLFFTYWFPDRHRARIVSGFTLALPVAVAAGAPMSTGIMELNGLWGLAGWKWMYLLEAVPTILLGVVVLLYLTDRPAQARWLGDEERTWLTSTIDHERRQIEVHRKVGLLQSFWDPKVLLLALNYLGILTASLGSFYGISFAKHDPNLAFALSAILNSSLVSFQLAFGGGAWGLERPTVEPKDLLSLRVPDLFAKGVDLSSVVQAESDAAANPHDQVKLSYLDQAVFEFYGLELDEAVLASESVSRARMLIFEAQAERRRFVKPPAPEMLGAYAGAVVRVVDDYLRAKGQRHLEATIYRRALVHASWTESSPGLTAVRFTMASGNPINGPIVHQSEGQELDGLSELIRAKLHSDIAPYLNERRLLRVYLENDLFVLKPSETRYWTQTTGLNDADIILADHWLGDHAVHA